MVKILRAVWETWVRSLGREDPLEKQMAIQYSLMENPVGMGSWQATVHGVAELDTTEKITLSLSSGNVHWGLIMCQVLGKALHITAFNFHSFLRQ